MRSFTASLAVLVAVAAGHSFPGVSRAHAAEARIGGFAFACKTLGGATLKPRFGDVPGVIFTDLPAEREACLRSIDNKIHGCWSNADDRRHAGCQPVFERQAEACAAFFRGERAKCDAGGATTPDPWADTESREEADGGARDPWGADERETARASVWDPPPAEDPWSRAESEARDPLAPDADVDGDEVVDEPEGGGYADTLAALERQAEEARRRAEREAELARQREEAERRRAEQEAELARRQAEREAEEARRREEAERRREEREAELARQREEEEEAEYARRQREDDSRRSGGGGLFGSGSSSSSGLFGSGSGSGLFGSSSRSGGSGLFQGDMQVLRDLQESAARDRERQRQEAERQRREWQAQQDRQRQTAERQQQEAERQRREWQAQQERQRQEAERQRRRQEAEWERERQRQEAERRRREEERRQEAAERRRRQAADSATAAHCLEARQLKGGFNVADSELRNTCGYAIEVAGACQGTSFQANYPYKGTYRPYENMGLFTLHPGSWKPSPSAEICHGKGRTVRWIACKKPFTPYFTSPSGGAYACFD